MLINTGVWSKISFINLSPEFITLATHYFPEMLDIFLIDKIQEGPHFQMDNERKVIIV
jgi:hypothetical protein